MSYAEFGLDTNKKSKDDDVISKTHWCLWCNSDNITEQAFALCFSNTVICKACVSEAFDDKNKKRWEETDYCFKCKKNPGEGYRSAKEIAGMHLCKSCIEWAMEVLKIDEMKKQTSGHEGYEESPQYCCTWPSAEDALKAFTVVDYEDKKKLMEILKGFTGYPFHAQWYHDLLLNKTTARKVIDSPEFIAILRMNRCDFAAEETTAMKLDAQQIAKIPEKEFSERGDEGVTGRFYQINNLVAYWKKQQTKSSNNQSKKSTMAKLKTLIQPAAVNPQSVEYIKLGDIAPSKTNPRKTFNQEYIQELAESMSSPTGQLQAIILRKIKNGYEIVAGECRFRAAKILKWVTIAATVREISDEDLLEFQVIENLQREDLSPLDEAVAFKTLLDKQHIDWLTSKIHKSKKYIMDRLKLNDLSEDVVDYVRSGVLPLGHAVVISKLSFADQQQCIDKCISNGFGDNTDDDYCKMPLEELKDFISDDIMLDLDRISFDPNDATLYPQAGACKDCPKRTCNSNLLFNDITRDDKCTDSSCFHQKITLNVARAKETAKNDYGKVLSGDRSSVSGTGYVKVAGVEVKYSDTPVKNAIPIVITKTERYDKNQMGKTVYVDSKLLDKKKVDKESAKEEKKVNKTNESYDAKRRRGFKELVWPRLETIVKDPFESTDRILSEYLRRRLEQCDMRFTMALSGLLGFNGFASTVDAAMESMEDDDIVNGQGGYSFEFRKQMYDKIIAHYSINELAAILFILETCDDEDDQPVDHEDEFGFSWQELMIELAYEKPVEKKPAPKKKATA